MTKPFITGKLVAFGTVCHVFEFYEKYMVIESRHILIRLLQI